jgi:hypothetical protein
VGDKLFYTVMKVKGRHYLYKVTYVGKGRKKYEYVGPCEVIEQVMKDLKTEGLNKSGARRLAWLGRRPHTAEVRGSSPRGPTKFLRFRARFFWVVPLCLISVIIATAIIIDAPTYWMGFSCSPSIVLERIRDTAGSRTPITNPHYPPRASAWLQHPLKQLCSQQPGLLLELLRRR